MPHSVEQPESNKDPNPNQTPYSLLELAANNDLLGFSEAVRKGAEPSLAGSWYCRSYGANRAVSEQRTPAMVAALYGSLDVLRFLLHYCYNSTAAFRLDINRRCSVDRSTVLHCAAMGASARVVETVRLLLESGASPEAVDANGRRPVDVIMLPHKARRVERAILEGLLAKEGIRRATSPEKEEKYSITAAAATAAVDNAFKKQRPIDAAMLSHRFGHVARAASEGLLAEEIRRGVVLLPEKEEKYSTDISEKPWLPDIKNNIYSTDEFRMFSFKVRPCSRAYSHDWTECPFAHPGENARRRDPRKHEYSYVACPDFRKAGSCRRGDACGHAHGVFECWLHPAQYRTRLCKDSAACTRKVCFFAHSTDELRKPNIPPHPSTSPPSVLDLQSAFSRASYSTNPLNIDMAELYKSQLLDNLISVSLSGSLSSPCAPSNLEDVFAYGKPAADSSPPSNIWASIQIPSHMVYSREEYQRSHSCRDLRRGSRLGSEWGSPVGKPKWAVDGDELSKLRKSASFAHCEEELDLPWLAKEGAMADMVYW